MIDTVTMKCSDVRRKLPAYLNGELDIRAAQLLRSHFGECEDCRTIVRSAIETFRENFREFGSRRLSDNKRAA